MFDLVQNPFLWQGLVFAVFGLVIGISLHSVTAVPRRIIEAI